MERLCRGAGRWWVAGGCRAGRWAAEGGRPVRGGGCICWADEVAPRVRGDRRGGCRARRRAARSARGRHTAAAGPGARGRVGGRAGAPVAGGTLLPAADGSLPRQSARTTSRGPCAEESEADESGCTPGSVPRCPRGRRGDGHPSRAGVATGLVRSTRGLGRAALERPRRNTGVFPFDLAPGGVYLAAQVTLGTGGLLHHRFTLTRGRSPGRSAFCGTVPRVTPGGR